MPPPIFPVSSRQRGRRAIHKHTAKCSSAFTNECARDCAVRSCGDGVKGPERDQPFAALSRCFSTSWDRSLKTTQMGGEQTTMSKQKGRRSKPAPFLNSCSRDQKTDANAQYKAPEMIIAAGSVSTHASAMLRTVESCSPEPLAAMVPAIPDDSTCVVETGRP
jgi:hypothetical protein